MRTQRAHKHEQTNNRKEVWGELLSTKYQTVSQAVNKDDRHANTKWKNIKATTLERTDNTNKTFLSVKATSNGVVLRM